MLPNRIHVSRRAAETLKILKGRTGVTPNLICRMALTLSLREGPAGADKAGDLSGSEFNLPTLLGTDPAAYEALLRWVHPDLPDTEVQRVVAGHIENGLEELRKARNLLELIEYALYDPERVTVTNETGEVTPERNLQTGPSRGLGANPEAGLRG